MKHLQYHLRSILPPLKRALTADPATEQNLSNLFFDPERVIENTERAINYANRSKRVPAEIKLKVRALRRADLPARKGMIERLLREIET